MKQNTKYFYFSGILSFCIYVALVFCLVASFISKKDADRYIMKNDTQYDQAVLVEALIMDNIKPTPPQEKEMNVKVEAHPKEAKEEQVQETLPGLKDLFSDIPDYEGEIKQKEKQRLEAENQRRIQEKQKRLQKQQELLESLQKNFANMNQTLNNMTASIDIKPEVLPNQDNGLYDEWIAKIYKILYENWSFSFYQDAVVSVLINITDTGRFSYKILMYSPYDEYNKSVIEILDRLRDVQLPPYPSGKFINIEVNFKAKAQDE